MLTKSTIYYPKKFKGAAAHGTQEEVYILVVNSFTEEIQLSNELKNFNNK